MNAQFADVLADMVAHLESYLYGRPNITEFDIIDAQLALLRYAYELIGQFQTHQHNPNVEPDVTIYLDERGKVTHEQTQMFFRLRLEREFKLSGTVEGVPDGENVQVELRFKSQHPGQEQVQQLEVPVSNGRWTLLKTLREFERIYLATGQDIEVNVVVGDAVQSYRITAKQIRQMRKNLGQIDLTDRSQQHTLSAAMRRDNVLIGFVVPPRQATETFNLGQSGHLDDVFRSLESFRCPGLRNYSAQEQAIIDRSRRQLASMTREPNPVRIYINPETGHLQARKTPYFYEIEINPHSPNQVKFNYRFPEAIETKNFTREQIDAVIALLKHRISGGDNMLFSSELERVEQIAQVLRDNPDPQTITLYFSTNRQSLTRSKTPYFLEIKLVPDAKQPIQISYRLPPQKLVVSNVEIPEADPQDPMHEQRFQDVFAPLRQFLARSQQAFQTLGIDPNENFIAMASGELHDELARLTGPLTPVNIFIDGNSRNLIATQSPYYVTFRVDRDDRGHVTVTRNLPGQHVSRYRPRNVTISLEELFRHIEVSLRYRLYEYVSSRLAHPEMYETIVETTLVTARTKAHALLEQTLEYFSAEPGDTDITQLGAKYQKALEKLLALKTGLQTSIVNMMRSNVRSSLHSALDQAVNLVLHYLPNALRPPQTQQALTELRQAFRVLPRADIPARATQDEMFQVLRTKFDLNPDDETLQNFLDLVEITLGDRLENEIVDSDPAFNGDFPRTFDLKGNRLLAEKVRERIRAMPLYEIVQYFVEYLTNTYHGFVEIMQELALVIPVFETLAQASSQDLVALQAQVALHRQAFLTKGQPLIAGLNVQREQASGRLNLMLEQVRRDVQAAIARIKGLAYTREQPDQQKILQNEVAIHEEMGRFGDATQGYRALQERQVREVKDAIEQQRSDLEDQFAGDDSRLTEALDEVKERLLEHVTNPLTRVLIERLAFDVTQTLEDDIQDCFDGIDSALEIADEIETTLASFDEVISEIGLLFMDSSSRAEDSRGAGLSALSDRSERTSDDDDDDSLSFEWPAPVSTPTHGHGVFDRSRLAGLDAGPPLSQALLIELGNRSPTQRIGMTGSELAQLEQEPAGQNPRQPKPGRRGSLSE